MGRIDILSMGCPICKRAFSWAMSTKQHNTKADELRQSNDQPVLMISITDTQLYYVTCGPLKSKTTTVVCLSLTCFCHGSFDFLLVYCIWCGYPPLFSLCCWWCCAVNIHTLLFLLSCNLYCHSNIHHTFRWRILLPVTLLKKRKEDEERRSSSLVPLWKHRNRCAVKLWSCRSSLHAFFIGKIYVDVLSK